MFYYSYITHNIVYDFIEHNRQMISKNNLLTGSVVSTGSTAENNISYTWFVNSNITLPANAVTNYL